MESATEVAEEISEEHWGGEDGDTDAGMDSSEIATQRIAMLMPLHASRTMSEHHTSSATVPAGEWLVQQS